MNECQCNEDSEEYCDFCFKQNALEAGIPLSVIEGKTKLRDHFSKEYIDLMCNKIEEGDS